MGVIGGRELIGRASERARITSAVAAAVEGRPTLVLVTGEAGTGKTSLVRWALSGGPARTIVVSGDEAEIDLDRGVVDQILRAAGVPACWEGRPDPAGAGAVLVSALADQAAAGPLALVVDDAQWADARSLRALTFAVRRLAAVPVAVCLTCRTGGVDRLPPGLVARAAEDGHRLALGALDPAAVSELAERACGRPLSTGAAERLHAHTGATRCTRSPCSTSSAPRSCQAATSCPRRARTRRS